MYSLGPERFGLNPRWRPLKYIKECKYLVNAIFWAYFKPLLIWLNAPFKRSFLSSPTGKIKDYKVNKDWQGGSLLLSTGQIKNCTGHSFVKYAILVSRLQ